MRIFKDEMEIKDKVVANVTQAFISPIKLIEEAPEKVLASLEKIKEIKDERFSKVFAELIDHPDLMYGSAILVSTVMNANDDVFLPEETWKAKESPINTPYNNEHVEQDIIGHIIASRPISEGKVIAEQTDYFDLEVDFVIYKSIFPAIAKDIYENAPKGKKFVSMEARFNDFAYALYDKSGEANIVERNEDTAFLTKYLRVYGGSGQYDNYKLGRILKDFRFVGMGNVDEPANSKSKYTKLSYKIDNPIRTKINSFLYITKGSKMTVENLEQAKTIISQLNAEIETFKQSETTKQIEGIKADKTKALEDLTVANTKNESTEKEFKKVNEALVEANKTIDTMKAEFKTKADQLEKMNKEAKDSKRLAKLAEIEFDVTDENKAGILEISDSAFEIIVANHLSVSKKYEDVKKNMKDKTKDGKSKAEEVLENTEKKDEGEQTKVEEKGDEGQESKEVDIQALAEKVMASFRKVKKPIKK